MKKITYLFTFLLLITFSNLTFAQSGLKADFYNGANFNQFVGTRIDGNIDFYWNSRSPIKGMNPNLCSVRWTGQLKSPKTGSYTFSARVDDGIRVWIDGDLVIDNWQLNDVGYSKGKKEMVADQSYDIEVEYFNALNEAEITLLWKLPVPENQGWWEWLVSNDKMHVITPEYYFQPKPKKVEVAAEFTDNIVEEPEPSTPVEKPKPIVKKSTPEKVVPVPPQLKKRVVEIIQEYIPKNVQFDQAKTEILSESFAELDKLADFLVKNPQHKIKIEGHTDNVGDAEKNFQLSHRRANAVAAYLIKKGVSHERLSAEGFGGSKPLVSSDGRKYHPENRRVEFIVE